MTVQKKKKKKKLYSVLDSQRNDVSDGRHGGRFYNF